MSPPFFILQFSFCNLHFPTRPQTITALLLAAVCCSTGCSTSSVRVATSADGLIQRESWTIASSCSREDPRNQHDLLAEWNDSQPRSLLHHRLHVKVLWPVHPYRTGSDVTAVNARIAWLIASAPLSDRRPVNYRLYEGTGHATVARDWLGRSRFTVRHAKLKLTRATTRPDASDGFDRVELEADASAPVRLDADESVARFEDSLSSIPLIPG